MSFLWTFRSFEICHIPIVCFCCFCKNLQRASPTLFLRPLLPVYPLKDGCTVVARLCANIVDKFFTTVQPLWSPWRGLSLCRHLHSSMTQRIPSYLLRCLCIITSAQCTPYCRVTVSVHVFYLVLQPMLRYDFWCHTCLFRFL